MNMQDPKYQQKSKCISSAEPNYFVHFAMRHPVLCKFKMLTTPKTTSLNRVEVVVSERKAEQPCHYGRNPDFCPKLYGISHL